MENMISFVHDRIKKRKYDIGIDFTMGNGHDTLFLSQYCQHVFSYDIQRQALENTKQRINDCHNVSLFLKSHEFFDEDVEHFDIGIFNLGYLPGGDETIVTEYQVTIRTLEKALKLLNSKGCLYIVVYIGHDQGEESHHLEEYFSNLNHMIFNVAKFEMMNKNNAPYVVIIEKR